MAEQLTPQTESSTEKQSPRGLLHSSVVVGSATMTSRVLGLLRDVVLAALVGAGSNADAFFVAFKIPNFLRRLFAEGAFAQAFIPVLAETREQGGLQAVKELIDRVAGVLGGTLLLLTALTIAVAPVVALIFAPGFSKDPAKLALHRRTDTCDLSVSVFNFDDRLCRGGPQCLWPVRRARFYAGAAEFEFDCSGGFSRANDAGARLCAGSWRVDSRLFAALVSAAVSLWLGAAAPTAVGYPSGGGSPYCGAHGATHCLAYRSVKSICFSIRCSHHCFLRAVSLGSTTRIGSPNCL